MGKNNDSNKEGKYVKNALIIFGIIFALLLCALIYFRFQLVTVSFRDRPTIKAFYDVTYSLMEIFGLIFIASQFLLSTISIKKQTENYNKQAEQIELIKAEYNEKKKALLRCTLFIEQLGRGFFDKKTYVRLYNIGLSGAYDISVKVYLSVTDELNNIHELIKESGAKKYTVIAESSTDIPISSGGIHEREVSKIIINYKDLSSDDFKEQVIEYSK